MGIPNSLTAIKGAISMSIYQSPICSCISCGKQYSVKGIHTHFLLHDPINIRAHIDRARNSISELSSSEIRKNKRIDNYIKIPNSCEYCNSVLSYDNRKLKFCNKSCAAKKNNSLRPIGHPSRIYAKTNLKMKLKEKKALSKSQSSKIYYCKACGKIHPSFKATKTCSCELSSKIQSFKGLNKYFGLNLDNLGTPMFINDFKLCQEKTKELYDQNSVLSLAKIIGHPDKTGGNVAKLLKNLNISLDNQSVAQQKSIKQNRSLPVGCYQFNSGWITINNKSYYYRSSYELDFINYLTASNINFDMETIRISYYDSLAKKYRIAVPDFIINKTIVEVKSDYWYNEQNMIDKFKSYIEHGYSPYLLLEKEWYVLDSGLEPKIMRYKGMVIPSLTSPEHTTL
jgi:hypothetical protein